ncbi:uncharacterized protein LOC119352582 [Triticum dicoccoides]|uniref:uncharacterized protein LOC119352582 n=1 Tax=Triticum dicoccoides TaxID=85692 RepID=UPI00188ED3B1|nr:uncharacterized protein LOC119352582 [Triticum dicoccoides]
MGNTSQAYLAWGGTNPPFKEVQDLWLDLKDPEDNKLTLKGLRKKMIGEERPRFVKPYVLYTIGKLTWFYEKFRVDHIDRTISYLQRDKPLIQYWDEAKAGKVDKMVEDLRRPWKPVPKVSHQPTKSAFEVDGTLGRVLAQVGEIKAIVSQQYSEISAQLDGVQRRQKQNSMRLEDFICAFNDHRFGVGQKDFNEGQRVNNIKKTSKNVAASTNEVPKCVYSNPSKNLAGEFEKVKKTPVDPHKGKTDRDDAVDSFGKRFRSDSKNLPSQSEVSITCLNHIASKGFISTIFLT